MVEGHCKTCDEDVNVRIPKQEWESIEARVKRISLDYIIDDEWTDTQFHDWLMKLLGEILE